MLLHRILNLRSRVRHDESRPVVCAGFRMTLSGLPADTFSLHVR